METLRQCLEALSPGVRARICREHGWREQEQDPEVLAGRLVEAARRTAAEPDRPECRLLRYAVFQQGYRLIPENSGGEEAGLSPSRSRLGWTVLRRQGFLYAVRRSWGETGLWCPEEIRDASLDLWLPGKPVEEASPAEAGSANPAHCLWNLVFHFLILLERKEIVLTKQGTLHRKSARKLAAELDLDDEGLAVTPWGGGEDPPGIRLLRDLVISEGLAEEREGAIWLKEEAAAGWSTLSRPQLLRRLFAFSRRRLLETRPQWDSLWRWMERHREVSASLAGTFLGWKAAAGSDASLEDWETACIRPLSALGWVETGTAAGGAGWWRWSPWAPPALRGFPELPAYVKPDFEVLIPVFTPWRERRRLAQFADYLGGEQLLTYGMNAASVRRGLEKGMSAGEMERMLTQLSNRPLPENVKISLGEWSRQFSRVVIRAVVLLRTGDPRLGDELAADPELSRLLGERVGPAAFIVDAEHLSPLRQQLKVRGTPPLELNGQGDGCPGSGTEPAPPPAADQALSIEDRFPALEEAIPGAHRLPRMWTSAPRPYHSSTLRLVAEEAARLGLDLKWVDARDGVHRVTVDRVFCTDGTWAVEGRDCGDRLRCISLKEIREVQILLPWQEESLTKE